MTAKITSTFKEEQKFGVKEFDIPEDQAWLAVMLERQTNALKSMRSMLQFFVVLVILGIIVQGCNLVLSTSM